MKRSRFFLLILLLLAQLGFLPAFADAPIEKRLNAVLKEHSAVKLQAFIDSLNGKGTSVRVNGGWSIRRELVSGYEEAIYDLERSVKSPLNPSVSTVYNFKTKIIINGPHIIYYALGEMKNKKVEEHWEPYFSPIDSYKNDSAYAAMQAAFKAVFGAEIKDEDLFQEDQLVYGESCGYGGGWPKGRAELNKMVAQKDKAALLVWLQSAHAEKQVYAVEGLYQLKKKGVEITAEEKKMIEAVKKKKGQVKACSGCIHFQEEIREVTKKFDF